jgi:hypothetical protein
VYTVNPFAVRLLRAPRLAALAVVMICVVAAAPRVDGLPPGPSPVRVGAAPGATGQTSVLGAAWRVDNSPIPGARVQLRNLVNGRVEATAVANEAGRFMFTRIEGGTYVVELVGENGKIVTVGHAFVIAPGETVATFVRLGTKVPWFSGFFANAASAVASTAAGQGITAMAPVQLTESR